MTVIMGDGVVGLLQFVAVVEASVWYNNDCEEDNGGGGEVVSS